MATIIKMALCLEHGAIPCIASNKLYPTELDLPTIFHL